MNSTLLSRRSFLKATAIGGAVAALGATPLAGLTDDVNQARANEASGETRVVKTLCCGCVGRCGVLAHVKDGRVIKLEGDPDHIYSKGRLCAKGLSFIQALYNPNRIKYPMRRAGERGENKWERVSWDEALDEIANQVMEAENKYGAETIIVGHGGGGHTFYADSAKRWCHVMGCHIFEPGGLQCLQPRQTMWRLMWGKNNNDYVSYEGLNVELYKMEQTKCMVLWGSNPAQSNVGSAGRPTAEMRANGTKSVVIDPRMTPDAAKADIWLPVRPGSDAALLLCWIKYIIDNDLYNHEAVMKWTNLPYLVNLETKMTLRPEDIGETAGNPADRVVWDAATNSAKVLSYPWNESLEPSLTPGVVTVNGIKCKTGFELIRERCDEWTLEKTAEVCWLEPGKIEQAIRLYAENTPSFISMGMALDHSANSTSGGIAYFILEAMMGNFCKPGVLMQQFSADHAFWPEPGTLPHFMPKEQYVKRFGAIEYKASNNKEWTQNSMMLDAIMSGEPYQPRVLIERSLNKLTNMPNAQRWAEAFSKMDYTVHHTMYPTSFSAYADLLLPTTEWLENHWAIGAENRVYVRQPATHLWEGVEEPMFWSMLAKKLADKGHQRFIDSFDPEKCRPTEENVPEGYLGTMWEGGQIPWWSSMEELLTGVFKSSGANMGWEELVAHVEENGCYLACPDEEYSHFGVYQELDDNGLPKGFNTPSRKLEAYGERIVTLGQTGAPFALYELPPAPWDYDPLPFFREPNESPLDPNIADEYPLVITGGHVNMYTHGTLRNTPWIRERFPVPDLLMNPVDAEAYGIANGDWVWIESRRGKTQGRAKVTKMVAPGVTHMERFWFPETLSTSTHGWKEMNISILTNDQGPFDDIIGSCTYRGFQVKVSKADSAPAGIWTEPEDFETWLPNYEDAEITDVREIEETVYHG